MNLMPWTFTSISSFRDDRDIYMRPIVIFFLHINYLERVDKRFLFRLLSWRRFFSVLARSTYFFLCSGVIRAHSLPAARAITVTCSFGFLLRNRRKKMMKGFVARTLCQSRELWPTVLPFPFAGRLSFLVSALRERRNCKVRFCVLNNDWSLMFQYLYPKLWCQKQIFLALT